MHLTEDEELERQARANPMEVFKYTFEDKFDKAVVERMDADEEFFTRLLDSEEFRAVVMTAVRPLVYRRQRGLT